MKLRCSECGQRAGIHALGCKHHVLAPLCPDCDGVNGAHAAWCRCRDTARRVEDLFGCSTCVYYDAGDTASGYCHRRAPGDHGFPRVSRFSWCGDHATLNPE